MYTNGTFLCDLDKVNTTEKSINIELVKLTKHFTNIIS